MQLEVLPIYTEQYDFPSVSKKADKVVCFWFIPRSGSNLLADLLYQTGLIGFPLEYFNPNAPKKLNPMIAPRVSNVLGVQQIRTSHNGVFSFKYNSNFFGKEEKTPSELDIDYHIFIDRKDRVAQAKSFAKAIKSKVWLNLDRNQQKDKVLISVKDEEVEDAMKKLEAVRQATLQFMSANNYLSLDFDDIVSNPSTTIKRIFNHCSLDYPSDLMIESDPSYSMPSSV